MRDFQYVFGNLGLQIRLPCCFSGIFRLVGFQGEPPLAEAIRERGHWKQSPLFCVLIAFT